MRTVAVKSWARPDSQMSDCNCRMTKRKVRILRNVKVAERRALAHFAAFMRNPTYIPLPEAKEVRRVRDSASTHTAAARCRSLQLMELGAFCAASSSTALPAVGSLNWRSRLGRNREMKTRDRQAGCSPPTRPGTKWAKPIPNPKLRNRDPEVQNDREEKLATNC